MARQVARTALYTVLGGWLVATVAGQKLFRDENRPSNWDKWYLVVPDWRFFAPSPGVHDYHILYRDELADGRLTTWRETTTVSERRMWHAVWHPGLRLEKATTDVVKELVRYMAEHPGHGGSADESVQLSVPYLTLLAHISEREHDPKARQTQFLISLSGGYDEYEEPSVLFVSALHPIRGDQEAGETADDEGLA